MSRTIAKATHTRVESSRRPATVLAALVSRARRGWPLAIGVAAGPLLGYILTRGPGLPAAMDDRGNWTETLGVISLVVEGTLLVLGLWMVAPSRRVVVIRRRAPAWGVRAAGTPLRQ